MKTNFKQTQTLEVANKDFKVAIVTMLNYKKQNKVVNKLKGRKFLREIETI